MSKQPLAVYAVRPSEKEGQKDFFTRIGTAFRHPNGEGMNLLLDAYPINPKLVVLPIKEREDGAEEPEEPEAVAPAPAPEPVRAAPAPAAPRNNRPQAHR